MNPRRGDCPGNPIGMPVQIWVTWFPRKLATLEVIRMEPTSGLEPLTCRLRNLRSKALRLVLNGLSGCPMLRNDATLRH
jgi:hypothetical protein